LVRGENGGGSLIENDESDKRRYLRHLAGSGSQSPAGSIVNPVRQLHDLGQSIWLDNISRAILDDDTLLRYIEKLYVTGLTSNPLIFDKAIKHGTDYDLSIAELLARGKSGEELFFELALQDLRRAADLFEPVFRASDGADGFVSLEISPLLANDTEGSIAAAVDLHAQAGRDNLFIKIPGTAAGIPAIEGAIYRGVPVNVTLLFSREQTLAASEAWMRGIERRIADGLEPNIDSVVSLFVSRWDVAVAGKVSAALNNSLGIAIAQRTWKAWCDLRQSSRWRKLIAAGGRPQRLLWASTGTKDPHASDTLYVESLAAPDTINTMPENTLLAFADHGRLDRSILDNGGDCEAVIERFNAAGIDDRLLADQLQRDGAETFVQSWRDSLAQIDRKAGTIGTRAMRKRISRSR